MKIQINSDKNIEVDAQLVSVAEADIERALERFAARLTRVEVYLSDVNSSKAGLRDKRAQVEARPAGQKPVSVVHEAATVKEALHGAASKMQRLLQSSFGKIATRRSRESVRRSPAAADPATAKRLDRIGAALSEILEASTAETSQLKGHVKRASEAVNRARSLAQSSSGKATGKKAVSAKKAAAEAGPDAAVSGRGPKKKQVFRARRKAWPKR